MNQIQEIEERRGEILQEMGRIKSLRRGSITKQYLKVRPRGKKAAVVRGPYYVLSRGEGGKTVSRRLTSEAEVTRAREEVAAHRRFRELCGEFEELTERLGELCRLEEAAGAEKKRRKSRWSGTRR
jgi:hypothetical protein